MRLLGIRELNQWARIISLKDKDENKKSFCWGAKNIIIRNIKFRIKNIRGEPSFNYTTNEMGWDEEGERI